MAKHIFNKFSGFNSVPTGTKFIGVYDKDNNKVGVISTGTLERPHSSEALCRFGILSNVQSLSGLSQVWDKLSTDFNVICGELPQYSETTSDNVYPVKSNYGGELPIPDIKVFYYNSSDSQSQLNEWLKANSNVRCIVITNLTNENTESINGLVDEYPRSIWFIANSYNWEEQEYNITSSVSPQDNNRDGGVIVRIPSYKEFGQGAVVEVYDDSMEISGLKIKNSDGNVLETPYLIPLGHYCIPTESNKYVEQEEQVELNWIEKLTSSMIRYNACKGVPGQSKKGPKPTEYNTYDDFMSHPANSDSFGYYIQEDESTGNTLAYFCFTKTYQGVFIAQGGGSDGNHTDTIMTDTDIKSGSVVYIKHDGVEWYVDGKWTYKEPEQEVLEKVGFYCGGYSSGDAKTNYTFEDGVSVDTSKGGIQLQTSSSFPTEVMSFPVRVCIKNLRYNQTQIAGPEREEPGTEEEEDNTNYNWTYLTSDKVIHNSTKNREYTYTVNDATHDLEVKFTKPSQGFFLSDGGETGTATSSGGQGIINGQYHNAEKPYEVIVRHDGLEQYIDGEWREVEKFTLDGHEIKIGIMTESSVYNNTNNVRVTNFNEGDAIRINISGTVSVPAEGIQIRFKNLRWKYYEEGDENIPDVVDDEITVRIDNNRNVIMDNVDSSASSLILKYLDENNNIITILDNIGESEIMEDPGEPDNPGEPSEPEDPSEPEQSSESELNSDDSELEILITGNEVSIDNVNDDEELILKYLDDDDEPLIECDIIGEPEIEPEPEPEIEISVNSENEISIDNVSDEESLVLKYETENDEPLMEINNIGETTLNNEEQ